MKSTYNFDSQITALRDICQTNIYLAQNANIYLKMMPQSLINVAVRQLKEEYEQLYLRKDEEKFNSIKSTLNMVAKEKATNVDELFMDLGFELNSFYGWKYLDLKKKLAYYIECSNCHRPVSNSQFGFKCHEARCLKYGAEDKRDESRKKKLVDTKEKYKERSERRLERKDLIMDNSEYEQKYSKKERLEEKKARKRQTLSNVETKGQFFDGFVDFDQFDDNMQPIKIPKSGSKKSYLNQLFASSQKTNLTDQQFKSERIDLELHFQQTPIKPQPSQNPTICDNFPKCELQP